MRTAVVYNPFAGRGRGEAIAAAVGRSLTRRGFETDLHPTRGPGDGTTIAAGLASEVDVLVVVGGDGTINEVVNGVVRAAPAGGDVGGGANAGGVPAGGASVGGASAGGAPAGGDVAGGAPAGEDGVARGRSAGLASCGDNTGGGPLRPEVRRTPKLGIVPAGTVNVFAIELGIPFRLERACDTIAQGKTRIIDLGRANDRRFALMAGVGVDALTVRNIDLRTKRRFKELAYLERGVKVGLSTQPPAFLVRVAGEEHRATFFVAGNCRYYAGRISITPRADPADGLLDLLIFTGTTRSSLAVFWLGVPSGLHVHNAHVIFRRAERAEILPLGETATVWFQTDGEAAGSLPLTVEIDAHVLEVLVP